MKFNKDNVEYFIGIDTGLYGAITIIDKDGDVLEIRDMPIDDEGQVDEKEIKTILSNYPIEKILVAYEKCQFDSKKAKNRIAFYFGQNYRAVITTLKIIEVFYLGVAPVTWQTEYSLIGRGKIESVVVASQLCKKMKGVFITSSKSGKKKYYDGRAESYLIAEYARRRTYGLIQKKVKSQKNIKIYGGDFD